ncbi:YoaK family protein [Rhodococcoides kyotonense]|uniref:Uncharacterized membrane protein YoaK, UPF0700 family n=1 Tax=Rhodococcoides kyotonense TaxID=398843 RepID=A0A239DW75_9NOCA|nr:YoaK family protein [Rhodococcus kyotonensis]SNS36825.1 Uncharacterized membrane protein YoaK, UPF0700 family [Rhodococcus kyotonensis]
MSPERRAVALMAALTFTTGIADAVGFLALDRIFVGNMTGNVIVLGMGVAGGDDLPVLGPVIALVSFTCGAVAAGFALRGHPGPWTGRTTALLAGGGLVLAAAAAAMFFLDTETDTDDGTGIRTIQIAVAAASSLAMGIQAAVARSVAVRDMPTVVVTSTLTSFASESVTKPNTGTARFLDRRIGAVAAIFVGAVVGALLLLVHPGVALLTAATVTLAVAGVGHRSVRPWTRPAT